MAEQRPHVTANVNHQPVVLWGRSGFYKHAHIIIILGIPALERIITDHI